MRAAVIVGTVLLLGVMMWVSWKQSEALKGLTPRERAAAACDLYEMWDADGGYLKDDLTEIREARRLAESAAADDPSWSRLAGFLAGMASTLRGQAAEDSGAWEAMIEHRYQSERYVKAICSNLEASRTTEAMRGARA
jgi:hypothetical protein